MSQQWYDPSGKWVLEERGASVLYLAGARDVVSCRARKAEVVQPRKLPDGLLEAKRRGVAQPHLVLVEIATYPEERVVGQISDGIRLVRQARGVLVDAIVLCLCRKGNYRVPDHVEAVSEMGWTGETLRWKVVELWALSAEELLTAPDVAVALFATLAKFDGPPELLLQRCRDRIERDGGEQKANLLAVAQVFARLHFDKPEWLDLFGGEKAVIESPFIQELLERSKRTTLVDLILDTLKDRFGDVITPNVDAGLALVKDYPTLKRLTRLAVTCDSLQAFESSLREELPKPPPPSTRGKRKPKKSAE